MTVPVIEDVAATARWRRRTAAAWVGAVTAVGGAAAAVGALVWQHPAAAWPIWLVGAAMVVGVGLAHRGWRRLSSRSSGPFVWRAALPTPSGPRRGWALRRPDRRRTERLAGLVVTLAVAAGAVSAAGGDLSPVSTAVVPGVVAIPAAVVLTRRLARFLRFPAGVAITADCLATADGLVPLLTGRS